MKVKKKVRLKRWVRRSLGVMILSFITIFTLIGIISTTKWLFKKPVENCKYNTSISDKDSIKEVKNEEIKEETQQLDIVTLSDGENKEEQKTKEAFKEVNPEPTRLEYRMTYYYPGDEDGSGSTTASGKSTKDFQLNENGWYTYRGKLVVATASERLLSWESYKNSTQPTYNLYDELILNIDGQDYEAVVMDVCGACMKSNKIDLYVKDRAHGLDTKINVRKAE